MDPGPGNDTGSGSTLLFQELGLVPPSPEPYYVQPPPTESEDESYSNSNSSESDGDEWESSKKEVQRKGKRGRKPKEKQGDDLTCKICNRSFTVSASLARHMVTSHSQNSHRYPCDICGKKFTEKHSVATHKLMVHEGKAGTAVFPCKKCELTYLKHHLLKIHNREVHIRAQMIGPEFRWACTEENCESSFVKKTNLEIHIKEVHVGNTNNQTQKEKTFKHVCNICNKRFQYPSFLRRHMPIHDESPALVQCTLCPRKLRPDLLDKHIYEYHRGEEQGRYKSKFCDRLFGDCHRRNEHDSVHRKKGICRPPRKFQGQVPFLAELKLDDIMDMEKNEKSGVIACRTCGVEFTLLRSLKSHQMLHASIELQHPCPICELKFRHENSLRSHIDTVHNGKVKCKSKFCDLTFRSSGVRNAHDKIHFEEGKCIDNRKPLDEASRVCQLCDPPQEFQGSYLFRIHQKGIHQILPKARATSKKNKVVEDVEEKEMSSESHGDASDSETETESESESESEVETEPNVVNPPIRNWEGFPCKLCPLEFRSQRNLNSHRKMNNAHPQLKIKLLKLKRRSVEAGRIFTLKLNANAQLWFICAHCGRASQSLQVAQLHQQQLHGDVSKTPKPKIRTYPKSHKRSSSYWPLLELSKQADPVEVIVKEEPTEVELPVPSDFTEGIDPTSFYFESTMKFDMDVESPEDFAVNEPEPHSPDHHDEEDYILPDVDWENNLGNRNVLPTKEYSGEFYLTSTANEAGAEGDWEASMTPVMVRHLSLLQCKLCSLRFHLGNVREHVQKHIDNGEFVGQNQASPERVNYQEEASEQSAPPPIKRARSMKDNPYVVDTGTDTLNVRVKSEVIPEVEEQQVPIGFKIFAGQTGEDVEWDPLASNTDQREDVVDINEPSLLTATNTPSNVNAIGREEVVDFTNEPSLLITTNPSSNVKTVEREVIDLANEPSLLTTTNTSSIFNAIEREEVFVLTNVPSLLTTNTSLNVKTTEREVIDLTNEPSPFTTTNTSSNVNAIDLLGNNPLTRASQQPSKLIFKLVAVKIPHKTLEIGAAKNVEDHLGLRKILPRILPLPSPNSTIKCILCECGKIFSESIIDVHNAYEEHWLRYHGKGKVEKDSIPRPSNTTFGAEVEFMEILDSEDKPFQCKFCSRKFKTISNILIHVQRQHPTAECVTCKRFHFGEFTIFYCMNSQSLSTTELCSTPEREEEWEKTCMQIIDGDLPFQCKFCRFKYRSKLDFLEHVARLHSYQRRRFFHPGNQSPVFDHKKKVSVSNSVGSQESTTTTMPRGGQGSGPALPVRSAAEISRKDPLTTSPTAFESIDLVESEPESMEIVETDHPFQSILCSKKFKTESEKSKHESAEHNCDSRSSRTAHVDVSKFLEKDAVGSSTPPSPEECMSNWDKTWMQIIEGDHPYQCRFCREKRKTKSGLLNHGQEKHWGERKRFMNRERSRRSYHRQKARGEQRLRRPANGATAFKCLKCGKIFSTKPSAQSHISRNHGLPSKGNVEDIFGSPLEPIERVQVGGIKIQLSSWAKKYMEIIEEERPFQCKLCSRKYTHKNTLFRHLQVHREARCEKCSNVHRAGDVECREPNLADGIQVKGIKIQLSGWAKKFMEIIEGEHPFQCKLCSRKYTHKNTLFRHLQVHPEARCEKCSNVHREGEVECRKPDAANQNSKLFYCDLCGAGNRRKDILKAHRFRSQIRKEPTPFEMTWMIYNSMEARNPFQCKICTESFPGRCSLRRHCKLTSHSIDVMASTTDQHDPRRVRCFNCNALFQHWKELEEHIFGMPECRARFESKECTLCEKKFNNRRRLRQHMRVTHPAERRHLCAVCGYAAKTKGNLDTHSRLHNQRRPFKCDLCKFRANTKQNLQFHRRTHTGEKPFLCEQCPYAAISMGTLKLHSRKHAKNKPELRPKEDTHTCDICKKVFKSQRGLTNHKFLQHESTSNGAAKPTAYTCTICKKQFTQCTNAGAHVRRHHSAELQDSSGEPNGKRKAPKDFIHVDETKRPVIRKRTKYEFPEDDESD